MTKYTDKSWKKLNCKFLSNTMSEIVYFYLYPVDSLHCCLSDTAPCIAAPHQPAPASLLQPTTLIISTLNIVSSLSSVRTLREGFKKINKVGGTFH